MGSSSGVEFSSEEYFRWKDDSDVERAMPHALVTLLHTKGKTRAVGRRSGRGKSSLLLLGDTVHHHRSRPGTDGRSPPVDARSGCASRRWWRSTEIASPCP